MSRQLKFRGKRIDNGEWAYGGFHKHTARQICPIGDRLTKDDIKYLIIQSGFADWNMPKPLVAFEVIPETVGQYTGLKDKNGVKIYEGDIVLLGIEIMVAVWDEEMFGLRYPDGGKDLLSLDTFRPVKDIGNIYDNPELLGL